MRIDDLALEPPAGWEAQTNVMLREPPATDGAFRLNVQVGTRPAPPSLSLQIFGMTQAKLLARELTGATITQQELDEIDGRAVYRLAYELEVDGTPMVQLQLFSTVADRLVTLTGTASRERAEELNGHVEGVLASLTLANS